MGSRGGGGSGGDASLQQLVKQEQLVGAPGVDLASSTGSWGCSSSGSSSSGWGCTSSISSSSSSRGCRNSSSGGNGSVTGYPCSSCGTTKEKSEYSKTMLKRNKAHIRCKICVARAQTDPVAAERVLQAGSTTTTVWCTVCGQEKDERLFSNNQRRGSSRKCQDCARTASQAVQFRCLYCKKDYADEANPMSMFVTKYRSPPFGPCCNRGDCMEQYHKAQFAAPEAEKKAAQLEKDNSTLEEQQRRTEEAFEESMATAKAESERQKRANEELNLQVQQKDGELRDIREAKDREQKRAEQLDRNVAATQQAYEAALKERDEFHSQLEFSSEQRDNYYQETVDQESKLSTLLNRATRDRNDMTDMIEYLMKEVLTNEDQRRNGARAIPGTAEDYVQSHGLSIEVRNMGDLSSERAGVQQLVMQNEKFGIAWATWADWVRMPWELYKVPDQEVLTKDGKAKLFQEEQSLTDKLRVRDDRISQLNDEISEAMRSRNIPGWKALIAQKDEASQGMEALRQEIENKRKRRLGLQESERVVDEEDERLQQINETCRQCGLSPLQTQQVKTEVLRAYNEQREYDNSTLVGHTMPWDPATDRVMPPKRVAEVMYHGPAAARDT